MLEHGVRRTPLSRMFLFLWVTQTGFPYLFSLRQSLKGADRSRCTSHSHGILLNVLMPRFYSQRFWLCRSQGGPTNPCFKQPPQKILKYLVPWQVFQNHYLEATHQLEAVCGLYTGTHSPKLPTTALANEFIDYPVLAGEGLEPCQEISLAFQVPGCSMKPRLIACTRRMQRGSNLGCERRSC